jgi:hypothetical protein
MSLLNLSHYKCSKYKQDMDEFIFSSFHIITCLLTVLTFSWDTTEEDLKINQKCLKWAVSIYFPVLVLLAKYDVQNILKLLSQLLSCEKVN